MIRRQRRARLRLAMAVMAWAIAVVILGQFTGSAWVRCRSGTSSADDAVATLAGAAGLVLLGWLAIVTGLAAVVAWSSGAGRPAGVAGRLAQGWVPPGLRHAVAATVVAALIGTTSPAQAAPTPAPGRATTSTTAPGPTDPSASSTGAISRPDLDPAWGRPAAPTAEEPAPRFSPSPGPTDQSRIRQDAYPDDAVVVTRGDTLWDLTARHLGPGATDAQIAQAWPQWFAANRTVIGPNPHLLRPGQRLSPPNSGGQP